jgi:molecular chaperone DnaK
MAKGTENIDGAEIKRLAGEVQQASLKLFEMIYKQKAGNAESSSQKPKDDDTVDADFKDVNEKK